MHQPPSFLAASTFLFRPPRPDSGWCVPQSLTAEGTSSLVGTFGSGITASYMVRVDQHGRGIREGDSCCLEGVGVAVSGGK